MVAGGREQITRLIGAEPAIAPDGNGGRVVLAPNGIAVNDFVRNELTSGKYSHFVRAVGPPDGAPTQSTPTGDPATASEWAIQEHAARSPHIANPQGTGGSIIDACGKAVPQRAAGFGLGRKR